MSAMWRILISLCFCFLALVATVQSGVASDRHRVLVVLSGGDENPWDRQVAEQIKTDLESCCDVTFFYLDNCLTAHNSKHRIEKAFALYQRLKPDGVIAVDDAAQSLFVVPYLKDKVTTPVIFAGIYAPATNYGYPAANVTGVQRHLFIDENIAFSSQLSKQVRKFAILTKDSPCAKYIFQQVMRSYPQAGAVSFLAVTDLADAVAKVESVRGQVDLLLLLALEGITDASGKRLNNDSLVPQLSQAFHGPTASPDINIVKAGALSGVLTSSKEIGQRAAELMLKVLRDTPLAKLPVTRNYRGTRMINVKALTALQIKPDPLVLRGTKLVTMP